MSTQQILRILLIISWIIFIGLCIKVGVLIVSFVVSLFVNPKGAEDLYLGLNFSQLYEFGKWHYSAMMILIILIAGLKANLFFEVVKILTKININHPFSNSITKSIFKMSNISIQIGIVAIVSNIYTKLLMERKIFIGFNSETSEFLFLAGILYVIAQIFKRGIELQSENELTV